MKKSPEGIEPERVKENIQDSLLRCLDYARRDPNPERQQTGLKRAFRAAGTRIGGLSRRASQPASATQRLAEQSALIQRRQRFARSLSPQEADALPDSPTIKVVAEIKGPKIAVQHRGRAIRVLTRATIIRDEEMGTQFFIPGRPPRQLNLRQLEEIAPSRLLDAQAALDSHASRLRKKGRVNKQPKD